MEEKWCFGCEECFNEKFEECFTCGQFAECKGEVNTPIMNMAVVVQEEIDEMQKEIEEEGDLASPVLGGPAGQDQGGAAPEPIDNTAESNGTESQTPQLDDAVNKYAFNKTK
jgi:hypothetical protein